MTNLLAEASLCRTYYMPGQLLRRKLLGPTSLGGVRKPDIHGMGFFFFPSLKIPAFRVGGRGVKPHCPTMGHSIAPTVSPLKLARLAPWEVMRHSRAQTGEKHDHIFCGDPIFLPEKRRGTQFGSCLCWAVFPLSGNLASLFFRRVLVD